MRITKIKVTNFKCYEETFTLALNDGLNVIVAANESGKTTILEAIQLALTGLLHGRPLKNDVTSYLFNLAVQQKYVQSFDEVGEKICDLHRRTGFRSLLLKPASLDHDKNFRALDDFARPIRPNLPVAALAKALEVTR